VTTRPALEVADVFRAHGASYLQTYGQSLSHQQKRVMRAIQLCRTAELGGHIDRCDNCGHQIVSYNSCRNRHCPKCQSLARARWLERRKQELLPVPYFHVVFTVPEWIADVALQNRQVVYDILFRAATETLRRIAADPKHLGADIGFLAILHTWGQNLLHHPHIHCVVPGGGMSPDGDRWISCPNGFFLPVRVLSRLFRRLFLSRLRRAYDEGTLAFHGELLRLAEPREFAAHLGSLRRKEWVVYAKEPFGGPAQVLEYLGRYTHRVAISNSRLLRMDGDRLAFRWKDYRRDNQHGVMTLHVHEFMRRFLMHVLPPGFVRIRHCGLFGNRHRKERLARCRELLGVPDPASTAATFVRDWREFHQALTGIPLDSCPLCTVGKMVREGDLPAQRSLYPIPVLLADSS